MAWVDRLPWPPWLFYLAVVLAGLLSRHAVRWLDGSLPAGSLNLALAAEAPFLVLTLATQHYLNATARCALQEFRPALQIDDAQYALLEYQLTTVPARAGLMAGVLGAALALLIITFDPASFGVFATTSLMANALAASFAMLASAFAIVFVYHTLRQLRLVATIHAMAKHVNLFQLGPIYAFSSLTARTGLAIVLFVYYDYFFFYYLGVQGAPGLIETAGLIFLFIVALACFVLPLNGIHNRLVQEKSQLLAETNRRTERTISALHQRVDDGEYDKVDGMQKTLATLNSEREVIDKISTWPWRTETLRGFLSTIALPVLLYLATRFLGRLLGI
jgi:hypothetical protein